MAKINGSLPVIMNLSFFMSVLLTCHLLVFLLIAIYSEFLKHLAWYYITYGTGLAWECTNLIYERIANHPTVLKPSKIVGGGTGNISAEDLQPFMTGDNFKYIGYMIHSEATALQSSNAALIVCDMPLSILLPKLTIADLKGIAKCHDIAAHSKSKSQELQTALSNHLCDHCDKYVSVFEQLDNTKEKAKKTAAHIQAVRKNQVNNPNYKSAHLNTVKKGQDNNPDYKAANLDAVKKHQANDPDYKAANIEAVKKHQANNPNYKVSNLNAVKKNQSIDLEKYHKANLESVKKYQEKKSKTFPPAPASKNLQHTIISNFCKNTSPYQFVESGCAVCGKLTPILLLQKLSEANLDLSILIQSGMTQ